MKFSLNLLICCSVLALGAVPMTSAEAADPVAAAQHAALGKKIAAPELSNSIGRLCDTPDEYHAYEASLVVPPGKVFDNLYYVGFGAVGSWALDTGAGIILFDTLNNEAEAKQYIEGGMASLGLDPANIKYIVVTHGHGDHYGGAHYLQDKYPGLKVMMSQVDYDVADKAAASPRAKTPAPRHDLIITDGQKFTLGDTTITFYITPGHTPGTVSSIFNVKDHGRTRIIAQRGGTGYPATLAANMQFGQSVERFTKLMHDAKVEGTIANHPAWDDTKIKLEKLKSNPNGPNPFLESPALIDRYQQVQLECMRTFVAKLP